jgi:serine/threonine protein kinase
MTTPAQQLKGLTLDGDWFVKDVAVRRAGSTGGFFSCGYIVEHPDGRRGFLKALDYYAVLRAANTPEMMALLGSSFVFEKTLAEKTSHLSRVVRAIGSGSVEVASALPFSKVDYLIFELADHDIRAHLDMQAKLDVVFVFRSLHHVAVGLQQLHNAAIAHQDLKPSNVLVYVGEGSKICDMGRAWDRNMAAPHDNELIAGQTNYAPVEALYEGVVLSEAIRRFGCDLYHLGNLVVFCFARGNVNAFYTDNLAPEHRSGFWGGTYEEVLPFLQAAFELFLSQFAVTVPEFCRAEVVHCVRELCNPDTNRRGHPMNQGRRQHSLERYMSLFDLLARKAKLDLIKSINHGTTI